MSKVLTAYWVQMIEEYYGQQILKVLLLRRHRDNLNCFMVKFPTGAFLGFVRVRNGLDFFETVAWFRLFYMAYVVLHSCVYPGHSQCT